jgi:hypothetical protein
VNAAGYRRLLATTSPRCSSCPSVKLARSYRASPWPASDQSTTPVIWSPSTNTWATCRSPCANTGVHGRSAASATRRLRVTRSAGRDAVRDEPLAFAVEVRCDLVEALTGPLRQRRVVQHPCGGTRRGPRRRRRGRRLAEAAECRPWEGGEREHRRFPPQDLRSRDGAMAIASTSMSVRV